LNIEKAREKLFAKNETYGYIEREDAIDAFLKGDVPATQGEKYVSALEFVLSRLSTPIEEDDLVLGRMVEGPIPYELEEVPGNGFSHVGNPFKPTGTREAGHINLDYASLMKNGLDGLVCQMEENAKTAPQKEYAALSRRAVEAVRAFAARYADAAEKLGMTRQAEALRIVPYKPAYDMFSAVQGVWIVEMILSCVTGGRDFAYSRFDMSLWPYYKEEEREDQLHILEAFYLKNNEIGGMNSDVNEDRMPVPCTSTNIYMMLGGRGAEHVLPLSLLFLEAAGNVHLPQPITALRIASDSPMEWKLACAEAAQSLSGQASFYNDDVLIRNLKEMGYTDERALNYTISGCNRADFIGHQTWDKFHSAPTALMKAFYDENNETMEDILQAFHDHFYEDLYSAPGAITVPQEEEVHFFLESLLARGCVENVCDIENEGQYMPTVVHHLVGTATVGNSLAAIQKAVFDDKIMTLDEFRALVRNNFEGEPELHQLIRSRYPKYGNDDPWADGWTAKAANIMVDATRELNEVYDRIHIPGLYSLFYHHWLAEGVGATPDGRLAHEPFSENQSPTYGTDHEGIAALLHSAATLPHEKIGCGGLNVRIEKRMDNELIVAIADTYFAMGGVNLCLNVIDRETLLAAYEHPELYQTLCVRIVGFSEIFVRLPEYYKQELINRTSVAV